MARIPATGHFAREDGEETVAGFELPLLAGGYMPVCEQALERIATLAEN